MYGGKSLLDWKKGYISVVVVFILRGHAFICVAFFGLYLLNIYFYAHSINKQFMNWIELKLITGEYISINLDKCQSIDAKKGGIFITPSGGASYFHLCDNLENRNKIFAATSVRL